MKKIVNKCQKYKANPSKSKKIKKSEHKKKKNEKNLSI